MDRVETRQLVDDVLNDFGKINNLLNNDGM